MMRDCSTSRAGFDRVLMAVAATFLTVSATSALAAQSATARLRRTGDGRGRPPPGAGRRSAADHQRLPGRLPPPRCRTPPSQIDKPADTAAAAERRRVRGGRRTFAASRDRLRRHRPTAPFNSAAESISTVAAGRSAGRRQAARLIAAKSRAISTARTSAPRSRNLWARDYAPLWTAGRQ